MAGSRKTPSRSSGKCVRVADRYAKDVVAGKVTACKWTRLACQRHLDDRAREKQKDYPYKLDVAKAEKVCRFVELLPHTKGKWAKTGETIKLEPWQVFLTVCVFGWVWKKSGLRRFRKVFLLISRKNGKSLLAAAWGLYLFAADEEYGAEVYSGATTEKQAWEVFRPARLIALRTPAMADAFGIEVNASNLHILGTGSRFEPLIGKPGDGASPSCSIHDEYHEHDTDEQLDTMETGMGARDQPLLLVISTAGDNIAGPCYQLQVESQKVLQGLLDNPELFACIFTMDSDDDWTSEDALVKANPNIGVSVHREFLESRRREAMANARKQAVFKTKHLNVWVGARDAYFNIQRWNESADPELPIEHFHGHPCKIGLDLASKVDIASVVALFEYGDGYAMFARHYLPEETVEQGENEHYQGWVNDGWITQTDGQLIDFDTIKADILDWTSLFQVEQLGYDPHQATMLVTQLQAEGVPTVEFRPTVLNFSEPMKTLDGLIRSRKVVHNGDPVMAWMMSNVVGKHDAKDNVYPRKNRDQDKIDGPVALMTALGLALAGKEEMAEPMASWV